MGEVSLATTEILWNKHAFYIGKYKDYKRMKIIEQISLPLCKMYLAVGNILHCHQFMLSYNLFNARLM